MKRVALITGANKGIGFEIVKQLGEQGFKIFLSARNPERGQSAVERLTKQGLDIHLLLIDVSQQESILSAFRQIQKEVAHLDVLINNAGILLDQGQSILNMDAHKVSTTFAINSFGPLYVTRAFLPLLKSGSRVINISSGAGAICNGMGSWAPIYSISKTTENAITIQLAYALESQGITVNAVCPGWVRTDMGGAGASRSIQKGAETPVWLATRSKNHQTGLFFRDKEHIPW